jgi:hypothetical protein
MVLEVLTFSSKVGLIEYIRRLMFKKVEIWQNLQSRDLEEIIRKKKMVLKKGSTLILITP